MINLEDKYICPFCGSENRLKNYEISFNSKGNKITYFKCRECNEKMKRNTLINDLTPFEWGEWIYLSIRYYNHETYKFFERVHFDKLIKNLKLYSKDIRIQFWDGYKQAKILWLIVDNGKNKGKEELIRIELKINANVYKPKQIRLDAVKQPNDERA